MTVLRGSNVPQHFRLFASFNVQTLVFAFSEIKATFA